MAPRYVHVYLSFNISAFDSLVCKRKPGRDMSDLAAKTFVRSLLAVLNIRVTSPGRRQNVTVRRDVLFISSH